jgi:hypothetical protein
MFSVAYFLISIGLVAAPAQAGAYGEVFTENRRPGDVYAGGAQKGTTLDEASPDPARADESRKALLHGHPKAHQHQYTHTHWHTHRLEDGTIVHHSHPHQHSYWHYGLDTTDRERQTRVAPDRETSPETEETGRREAGTSFQGSAGRRAGDSTR